ncbi:Srp19 [Drosophila busckii]|uniref:Srp19 n=1 Tax=Drosophila busckii TaxID=30019 RepID=A0A0M4E9J5_DROBS|nr:signal recognition particle 19 kDa protein [Drosophila busckii]ALC43778.1 Srp19 [Drosophila busckii]
MAAASPVRTNWHPNMKHSDVERWICLYPAYINSKKTRQEGRRLAKNECVDNPTYVEIRDVLSVASMQFVIENKQYCREKSRELQFRGRVRVQLRNADGSLCNPNFPTRESVMKHVASKIPQLKTRQNKPNEPAAQQQSGGGGGAAAASSAGGGGGGGGKKGKGKRR